MSCDDDSVVTLEEKRSDDIVPIEFDWHDFLARLPRRGFSYAANDRVRLPRSQSTGLQYKASAGVTGSAEPRWPKVAAGTVLDGTVTWTAEAIDENSLRTTISSEDYEAEAGVTLGAESIADLVYTVMVSGGTDGNTYDIKHEIMCANGEDKEAIGRLPVED